MRIGCQKLWCLTLLGSVLLNCLDLNCDLGFWMAPIFLFFFGGGEVSALVAHGATSYCLLDHFGDLNSRCSPLAATQPIWYPLLNLLSVAGSLMEY